MTESRITSRRGTLAWTVRGACLLVLICLLAGRPTAQAQPKTPAEAPRGGALIIDGVPMLETDENYLKTIKFLAVSPGKHTEEDFLGTDPAVIKAMEHPIRRQIFNDMNLNKTDKFEFADLDAARENFNMRIAIVFLMIDIHRGRANGGVSIGYYSSQVPAYADPTHWVPIRGGEFTFTSRPKSKPADAIDALFNNRYRGECLGCCQAVIMKAARKVMGEERFNELHAKDGLAIKVGSKSVEKHVEWCSKPYVPRDFVVGDWVYMTNKHDYNTDLTGPHHGLWSGENAIYMGRYDQVKNFVPDWKLSGSMRYSGLGQYNKTETALRTVLRNGYNNLMRPPFTYRYHSITDKDIYWDAHARPVIGE